MILFYTYSFAYTAPICKMTKLFKGGLKAQNTKHRPTKSPAFDWRLPHFGIIIHLPPTWRQFEEISHIPCVLPATQ
jgi:hypothetical protein